MIGKRIIVVCILLLPAIFCYSKQRKVNGKVTDDTGKPVGLCLVKAVNSGQCTKSNASGEFSLEYDPDSTHALIFSCAGYETREVKIDDDAPWVLLKHKINSLGDALVEADHGNGKLKHGTLGQSNKEPKGVCSELTGTEIAVLLNADPGKHALLNEAFFYITKNGVPGSKFRVHVYNIGMALQPGAELLDSVVIIHADEGDEWLRADLSGRHIPIGSGVFISMEWLSGTGNNPTVITDREHPERWIFNTQALGITKNHKQGLLNYRRSNFNHEWNRIDAEPEWHGKNLAPMIYATYTYYKK